MKLLYSCLLSLIITSLPASAVNILSTTYSDIGTFQINDRYSEPINDSFVRSDSSFFLTATSTFISYDPNGHPSIPPWLRLYSNKSPLMLQTGASSIPSGTTDVLFSYRTSTTTLFSTNTTSTHLSLYASLYTFISSPNAYRLRIENTSTGDVVADINLTDDWPLPTFQTRTRNISLNTIPGDLYALTLSAAYGGQDFEADAVIIATIPETNYAFFSFLGSMLITFCVRQLQRPLRAAP